MLLLVSLSAILRTDPAILSCVALYATSKDILIPDLAKQFKFAGKKSFMIIFETFQQIYSYDFELFSFTATADLLNKSLNHGELTPGQQCLGAALMHTLISGNMASSMEVKTSI